MSDEEMYRCVFRIAKEHFFNGDDDCCNFTFEEKNAAVKVANFLRSHFEVRLLIDPIFRDQITYTVFVEKEK